MRQSTIHHPPSTIHHPPSTIHHPPIHQSILALKALLCIKNLILIFPLSILFSFSCFGQAAEPTNFEWKKTVEINRRLETFYNENVLTNMPPNARFWVDIKPISSKTLKVTYANGGYKVYQSHEKLENKFNDVPFNHGLHKSIEVNGRIYFSLVSSPDIYKSKSRNNKESFIEPIRLDFRPDFDIASVLSAYRNDDEWISFQRDGKEWFASDNISNEFSFDPNLNVIESYNAAMDTHVSITYAEVHPDIWDVSLKVTTYPEETIDGICLSRKETIEYTNYDYQINSTRKSNNNDKTKNGVYNIIQNGNEISFNSILNTTYNIIIYDVNGMVINSITSKGESFYFKPPYTGIYFLYFSDQNTNFSTKVFLKN